MRLIRATFLAAALITAGTALAATMIVASTTLARAEVRVVASIKPVHSLVAAVMQGVGTPDLIVAGAGSPHSHALKPSQAGQLQNADLVFWIGPELEAFLEKSITGIARKAVSVELMDSRGLSKIKVREGDDFDDHGHDDSGHDDHKGRKDDEDDDDHDDDHDDDDDHEDEGHKHDHADKSHAKRGHDDSGHDKHGHDEDEFNPHVWLDPLNAGAMVREIADRLSQVDPANAAAYAANADRIVARLNDLVTEIDAELAPVKGRGYVVFHDAYQYFETRFGVSAVGSITVSPEVLPGAERVRDLQSKVRRLDARCVFSEPQFEPKLVVTVTENTKAETGVLDPLGATITAGPELYFTLIRNLAGSMRDCLS